MQLEALRNRFATFLRDELERAEGTIRQYVFRLGYVETWTGKSVGAITADDLRELRNWLRKSGYSSSYVKSVVVAVKALHKWGVLEKLWEPNGLLLFPTPKEHNNSPPPLSEEKAQAVLEAAQGPLETRVAFLGLYAGTRIGESVSIEDDHWQEGWLRFRREKTRKLGEIPVHPALEERRGEILAFPKTHKESLQNAKERIEERVGFGFVAHQLRKTFASTLYDLGTDDRVVRDLLGHSQDVTGLYVVVSQRKKIEAINRLAYGLISA